MIVIGIGFLALFAILSIALGSDERQTDIRDDARLWIRFVAH